MVVAHATPRTNELVEGGKDSPDSVDTEHKGHQFVLYIRPMAGRAWLVTGRRSRDEPLLILPIAGLRRLRPPVG